MARALKDRELAILILLFASFRFFSLMLLRPGGFIADFSDFNVSFLPFARWSRYGIYPYFDFWMEYPPLLPWMVVLIYRASLLLPPWDDPRLWFNTLMGSAVLVFDLGNLILLYLMGCKLWGKEKGSLTGWAYLGLFALFYTAMGWLDNITLFFILLTLYLWIEHRLRNEFLTATLSGAALAAGFMFKISPALLLPLGLKVMRKKAFAFYLAIFVFTAILIGACFAAYNLEMFIASFRAILSRSPWETVWALASGYYSYGVIAGDRFSIPSSFAVYQPRIPNLIPLLIWMAVYLWVLLRPGGWNEPFHVIASASLVFFSYELLTPGYSPQHIVYFLPFLLLIMPEFSGILGATSFTLVNLFEAIGYFIVFPQERWLLSTVVILRTAGLLVLVIVCVLKLAERKPEFGRRALEAWSLLVILCLVIAVPFLGKIYFQARLAKTQCAALLETLQNYNPGKTIVFLGSSTHDSLYPYIRRTLRVALLPESPLIYDSLEKERLMFFKRQNITGKFLIIANQAIKSEVEALGWVERIFGPGLKVSEANGCLLMEFGQE